MTASPTKQAGKASHTGRPFLADFLEHGIVPTVETDDAKAALLTSVANLQAA